MIKKSQQNRIELVTLIHRSELNYEDLPKPVTEINNIKQSQQPPGGKKVKDNVRQFLERGKQKLFQGEGLEGGQRNDYASNGYREEASSPKGKRNPLTGKWDQVRQKIFTIRKNGK